jgi:hypothetical protein
MKNSNTNTSIYKKVGFVLLFSLFAFSNYGVKGQGYQVFLQTELVTNSDRFLDTPKYVTRLMVRRTSGPNNTGKFLITFTYDHSYNDTSLTNPQYFLIQNQF